MLAVLCFVNFLLAFMHRVCGLGYFTVCKLAVISRIAVGRQASRVLRPSDVYLARSEKRNGSAYKRKARLQVSITACTSIGTGGDGAISIAIDGHPPHRVILAWRTSFLQFTFSAMQAPTFRELARTTHPQQHHDRTPP